ncbi:MAG: hypothetical protein VST69_06170 [Nitrospirota bacterium]|nr:hypothetical protein [Nitrospirota bacterium]
MRRFWAVHRHPTLLFPNRQGGLKFAHLAQTPLDRGGIQTTLCKVTQALGFKKNYAAQSAPQLCNPSD